MIFKKSKRDSYIETMADRVVNAVTAILDIEGRIKNTCVEFRHGSENLNFPPGVFKSTRVITTFDRILEHTKNRSDSSLEKAGVILGVTFADFPDQSPIHTIKDVVIPIDLKIKYRKEFYKKVKAAYLISDDILWIPDIFGVASLLIVPELLLYHEAELRRNHIPQPLPSFLIDEYNQKIRNGDIK